MQLLSFRYQEHHFALCPSEIRNFLGNMKECLFFSCTNVRPCLDPAEASVFMPFWYKAFLHSLERAWICGTKYLKKYCVYWQWYHVFFKTNSNLHLKCNSFHIFVIFFNSDFCHLFLVLLFFWITSECSPAITLLTGWITCAKPSHSKLKSNSNCLS